MPYAELLRAALAEPDWSILQRLAEIAVRLRCRCTSSAARCAIAYYAHVTDLDLTTEGDA